MLIETDYRGHRIEVTAQHVDGAWDAEVRIRRTLSERAAVGRSARDDAELKRPGPIPGRCPEV
jgi:hypothetical protein